MSLSESRAICPTMALMRLRVSSSRFRSICGLGPGLTVGPHIDFGAGCIGVVAKDGCQCGLTDKLPQHRGASQINSASYFTPRKRRLKGRSLDSLRK